MKSTIYESVTNLILEALNRGVVPWRKPWTGQDALPMNLVSSKTYRGVNVFLLALAPYADHRWLTFKQVGDCGGTVRKGERSTMVVFWKRSDPPIDPETGEVGKAPIPILRYYHVFNVEQCEGLNVAPVNESSERGEAERIEKAEALLASMPDPPRIEVGHAAWYRPNDDLIQVPPIGKFRSSESYYATLFHELGHATGNEKRFNRPGVTGNARFGSGEYSQEELVAELTSAFCCAVAGLDNSFIEDAASYIQGWLKVLKSDPKAMVIAATQAQRAADYIMGVRYANA